MKTRLGIGVAAWFVATGGALYAQQGDRQGAAVVVDGLVRGVYRNVRADQSGWVVQIEAVRTELGRGAAEARRQAIPVPGDPVYVHAASGAGLKPPVAEGESVRAYLSPRDGGGWQGTSADWFDHQGGPRAEDRPVQAPPAETVPIPDVADVPAGPSGKTILKDLGLKAEAVDVNGRMVLRVTETAAGSPAGKAGLEKGDVVIGVNRSGFASLQQFAELLTNGGAAAELIVLNVRTNEQTPVPIDVAGLKPQTAPTAPPILVPTPSPTPAAPARTLGLIVEPVRMGLRRALRVTSVKDDGAAKKAGFEVGDVLVEAGGITLDDPARLQEAVDKAGETLSITVRDVRSGRDVPVEVALGATTVSPTSPSPSPAPTPAPPTGGRPTGSQALGLTVKPGTADLLPVVKVAAVVAGSPADKAGLEVGDAIVGVNDRVVFAPDLFEAALKDVGNSFTLSVLDVKTGKKTPVKIELGR